MKRVPLSVGREDGAGGAVWVQAREIAAYLREFPPAEIADELDRLADRLEAEEARDGAR